ncbi:hypothetical protein M5D96_007942 [Drosophila gunungcola]|uniref:Uncharacterized protein n=1 Tax=Drosophila gunungcola TaxID=103775 RepID=A0A9P9YLH4_9MUSC|nr:hypothetical protein M5D96_007942 [Drosophila gunungcola]
MCLSEGSAGGSHPGKCFRCGDHRGTGFPWLSLQSPHSH